MLSPLPPSLLFSLLCVPLVLALPSVDVHTQSRDGNVRGFKMPLRRRLHPARTARSVDDLGAWAKSHRDYLIGKYGGTVKTRRSYGENLLVDQDADSSYYGSIAVGTPPVSYDVIIDSGSADLWLASSSCSSGCSSVGPTFNPSDSSTFSNKSTAFSITYGSGSAQGYLATDTVQMAGFSVSSQTFAVCDVVSDSLITSPVSGLMGFGFKTIAASGATPFWQTLAASGAWDSPLMSVQITRYLNDTSVQSLEPGGTLTMGFVNESLYRGEIEYTSYPSGVTESYWLVSLEALTVAGSSVTLPTGSDAYAAIDTGTTLVGGPSEYIKAIYELIEGAEAGTGDYEGYYLYPCKNSVTIALGFGNSSMWTISPADFEMSRVSSSMCLGAFFDLTTGDSAPSWIVGDTFLKNVYTVLRYDSPAIGFANLSELALSMNGNNDLAVPSATVGSVVADVSSTSI
ncbi:acid protease, partial [Fistulina hepatica ATCC 64428]